MKKDKAFTLLRRHVGRVPARGPRTASAGFTLIEVLLAMVVIGVAFIALSQGIGAAAHGSSTSQKRTRAVLLASRMMVDVETGAIDPSRQNEQGTFPEPDQDFSFEMTPEMTLQSNVYDVALTVRWGPSEGESVVLHRLINTTLRAPK